MFQEHNILQIHNILIFLIVFIIDKKVYLYKAKIILQLFNKYILNKSDQEAIPKIDRNITF